jgi:hypothetical protein
MGSVGIAAWIAKLLFLGLMIAGIVTGQLRARPMRYPGELDAVIE